MWQLGPKHGMTNGARNNNILADAVKFSELISRTLNSIRKTFLCTDLID